MESFLANFMSVASDIRDAVSTGTFLSGLSAGAVGGFFGGRFIDWYMVKHGTRRAERERRRLDAYEQILGLVEDFHGKTKLLHYRLAHRNPTEETRIVQNALKEGKDPGHALADHMIPDNDPAILAIEIRKHLGRIDDLKLESLVSDWAKALDGSLLAQRSFWEAREKALPEEKWLEFIQNLKLTGDQEIQTKKALREYLRRRLA